MYITQPGLCQRDLWKGQAFVSCSDARLIDNSQTSLPGALFPVVDPAPLTLFVLSFSPPITSIFVVVIPVDCTTLRILLCFGSCVVTLPDSDGDVVFQPRKIQRSGIWNAVEGRVLIYVHKERAIDAMRQRYPARHYVMVDDKAPLLAAMKRVLGSELTTVFVHQGHYAAQFAAQSANAAIDPPPELEIERIGDLLDHDLPDFLAASAVGVAATNQERT